MQIIQIIQVRNLSALNDLHHEPWESIIICPMCAQLGNKVLSISVGSFCSGEKRVGPFTTAPKELGHFHR